MFKCLFGKKKDQTLSARNVEDSEEQLENAWYDEKTKRMVAALGQEHDMVMHAIIPYEIGGGLDLYYYPNGIQGTGIATKELSHACRNGSSNIRYEKYEFVMFTCHAIALDDSSNEEAAFGLAHQNINSILNPIARYSEQANLRPNDTLEFPKDFGGVGGKCLVFSDYTPDFGGDFGIMLVMEVHRSEMEFARKSGGEKLIKKLVKSGFYPYSDLARKPVI